MCRALIIGAGGVGTVVTQKIAADPVFTDVMLASRTKSKCDAVAAAIGGDRVKTAQVDADNVAELCELFRAFRPDIVVNVALPYQVPIDQYFVLGDHRSASIDSRHAAVGCVGTDMVLGRVACRIWPLDRIDMF